MGAAAVAAPAAAASAAALTAVAAPGAPLVAALETAAVAAAAAGPLGWLVAGTVAAAGVVVVAGDEELVDRCCWQQILFPRSNAFSVLLATDESKSQDSEPIDIDIDFHSRHGMLLSQVLSHTKAFKSKDDERLVVKNKWDE
ncbi:hypothetical protein H0H81_000991 [Sphagnurus paluster]|uniref:Uncharacterized protein n=1 Tax=Sphagnurus paluster TaxID=117069 RepID=A0A9P7KJV4_9AGAR|nr:hypothetical protein H0H81_000991 [Sphagnurus paluster]